ncbi:MAG TPA: sialidase family protein [Anaerolineaceae bacterium]
MYIHPRSLNHKIFDVWRSPGRFTKNPDIVRLPKGRLLLVYSDNDAHWSQENQVLTILASDDDGRIWFKLSEVDRADLRQGDERLVTPRLSLLSDGRLVVLIDHDDNGHFHIQQKPGIWAYWSTDGGRTWSAHQDTGIPGFEPDRMMELPDGRLAVATHVMLPDGQEFADVLSCSEDGGQSWYRAATMAFDGYHRFCEGAIIHLKGGELACVMRENHSRGIPCFVVFSSDSGNTWSPPQMLPFSIHRPYGKQLPDGRVLITGRHMNGPIGTYAWVGDLKAEAGTYAPGGPRSEYHAELSPDTLVITNSPGMQGCRYSLLPPESSRSHVVMDAVVKVEGPAGVPVAFMGISKLGIAVQIASNGIRTRSGVDFQKPVNMTQYHRLTIHHQGGWLQVQVDGETVIHECIYWDTDNQADWFARDNLAGMTWFGETGDEGRSFWKSVRMDIKNRSLLPFSWNWEALSGKLPDDYQRTRMIQLHVNVMKETNWPDHGYSSWLTLPDGRILLVDYTNLNDLPGKSHLVGLYLDSVDLV